MPLKLHFTTSYDLFKYSQKSKSINKNVYESRKDKALFEKWGNYFSSDKRAGQLILANFVYNEHNWVYQAHQQAEEIFLKWKAIRDSQLKTFNDGNLLLQKTIADKELEYEQLFIKTPKGNKPPLLQLFLAGYIGKEYIVILDIFKPFLKRWGDEYEIDPLISDQIFLLKKYQPFIEHSIDKDKITNTLQEFNFK